VANYRLVQISPGSRDSVTLYRIERRVKRWLFLSRWIDGGLEDFTNLKDAQEAFISYVANKGPLIILAEME
jgi:hypothetical protein